MFSCTKDQLMFEHMFKLEKRNGNMAGDEEMNPQRGEIRNLACSWIWFLKRLNEGISCLLDTPDLPSCVFNIIMGLQMTGRV